MSSKSSKVGDNIESGSLVAVTGGTIPPGIAIVVGTLTVGTGPGGAFVRNVTCPGAKFTLGGRRLILGCAAGITGPAPFGAPRPRTGIIERVLMSSVALI